ncbi:hypothetical protein FNV43_RR05949 [Rhamnella rubrinervis]|uniref:Uncharacterized protein n=1 Tax=Rhamnella rubrinervis TaxID=2594499 RepID=A0A8K0MLI2_9ROSA|nr:hypothetical protein FNV43_RR05949 [Rhamnella rubrinervis]
MAADQKDEESNIVVDLRTRVSNLSMYINIMDKDETQLKELLNSSTAAATSEPSQINAVDAAIEQLQKDQQDSKKVFNQLLEEYSSGGGNLDDLGFKILKDDVVVESSSSSKPKKDVIRRKRSQWSKELKNREGVKAYAVEVGTFFSFLLVHLMLFVLQRREIAAEFQRLKNLVRSLIVGTTSLVPNRMDREDIQYEVAYKERALNKLFDKVLHEILHLESIWKVLGQSELVWTEDVVSSMGSRIVECREGLKIVRDTIVDLGKEVFQYVIEDEDGKSKEFGNTVYFKIKGIWENDDEHHDDDDVSGRASSKRQKV